MTTQILLDINEAAAAVGVHTDTIRRAIHTTDPTSFPPPLRAKRIGTDAKYRLVIPRAELERWVESLKDA